MYDYRLSCSGNARGGSVNILAQPARLSIRASWSVSGSAESAGRRWCGDPRMAIDSSEVADGRLCWAKFGESAERAKSDFRSARESARPIR